MQKQQTSATMRSDCPRRLQLKNTRRENKKKRNRMPSEDKRHRLMLVMKSKENVSPSLLYPHKRMSSVFQIKKESASYLQYGVRIDVPGICVKKIQHIHWWVVG